jgi:hypothetical protein
MKTYDDLEEAKNNYDDTAREYLTSSGWNYTSSTPGFFWLWKTEWDGQTILVEQDLAVSMQKELDYLKTLEQHEGD